MNNNKLRIKVILNTIFICEKYFRKQFLRYIKNLSIVNFPLLINIPTFAESISQNIYGINYPPIIYIHCAPISPCNRE